MYYKVPIVDGMLDIDYEYLEAGIGVTEATAYVRLRDGFTIKESWQAITVEEWQAVQPIQDIDTIIVPDVTTLLDQHIVQQTLKNAELEQKLNTIGQGVVQLMLKGSA